MNIEIVENELGVFAKILFSKDVYAGNTLLKVSYNLTEKLYIFISENNNNYEVNISLKSDGSISKDNLMNACGEFMNELADQEMRQIVINETSNIRENIISYAFSEAAKGIRNELKSDSIPKSNNSYHEDKLNILNLKG